MWIDSSHSMGELESAYSEVEQLRRFTGPPQEFWPRLTAMFARMTSSVRAVVLLTEPGAGNGFRRLGEWVAPGESIPGGAVFQESWVRLFTACTRDGSACETVAEPRPGLGRDRMIGISLPWSGAHNGCAVLLYLRHASDRQTEEAMLRARLASDLPSAYQVSLDRAAMQRHLSQLQLVLEVLADVNSERRFAGAGIALCNAIATRFHLDRVALGWSERGRIRICAISRTEKFDPRVTWVEGMESLMEENREQDVEILWPAPDDQSAISRDHETFARAHAISGLATIPIRLDHVPIAVLALERQGPPFQVAELLPFRAIADQLAPRLEALHVSDRGWPIRMASSLRRSLAWCFGTEHTWQKLGAIGILTAALVLFVPTVPYRVRGTFILRSTEVSIASAPFDGFIQNVDIRPGDSTAAGTELLRLNTDQLELDEAAAAAELSRHIHEAERHRANHSLAEMRIAEAYAEEARARLNLVRYRLGTASIRAQFAGVVIEGDQRQRIGAAVRQGEELFRLARIDSLYVEAEVSERDIHDLQESGTGEIAFLSRPRLKFPVKINRIEAAASPKEHDNVYRIRCAIQGPIEGWWRPGMSGSCRLIASRRTLFWILTHRTVDFLRMSIWF